LVLTSCACLKVNSLFAPAQIIMLCNKDLSLGVTGEMAKRDYLVEAAKQIRMALDREVNEDYEAAFSYYKNGVDLLLNGVQLDPNKDRREAVKRKTAQYLKRAEEIFISHLQDNLGKGSSHLGGYSSLRFRPIRHLSSPVEDLEMCKVVGVIDKVLIVQSMVNKETFVVKSLAKSSWESRDKPTIIPQGVPYMVKLLRYYVSEDAVYLHLEHVQGELLNCSAVSGRLFSKLHKVRSDKAKEHPECFSPGQHRIKLRTRPLCDPYPSGPPGAPSNNRTGYTDALLKSGGSGGPEEDQIIEVDGWCHLPRFPVKSSRTNERAMQACWGLPEAEVRVWGAQILLALENLHQQGILCRDLNPKNILLTSNGKVCLTFFGQWSEVQSEISSKAMEQMYCAPEIGGVSKITEACDWWSLGALLFELLTGMVSNGSAKYIQPLRLLQFDAGYRLGSGGGGVSDIKCHPFFSGVSWKALSC
uniref:Ribosomal protein S6 kinase like 1 n=1 Tax=Myripristis murdjan TaxID=586833 RepID=A0A667YAT5_9TELE